MKWRQSVGGPAEQFTNKSCPDSTATLSSNGSCHKAQRHWDAVNILITPAQAKNKRCSFLILIFFFPMQDLEPKAFVYLSIKNQAKEKKMRENLRVF